MKRDAATAELSREELEAEVAALRSENAQLRTAPLPPLNPLPPLAPLPAFDPLASRMVAQLGREFEYEWVAVRCQFILGMLMLVAAQAIRVRYALWSVPNLANAAATFLLFIRPCSLILLR